MRVIGVKAKKISLKKPVLIVKFISQPSLKNVQIQLFWTSLGPKTKQVQGADLSIVTTLKISKPGAKSPFDLGVRCKPRCDTTRNMIAAFDSMMGGTTFHASQASSDVFETSEQIPFCDEFHLQSSRDPIGCFKGTTDPKHHGQAMRSAIKTEWVKVTQAKWMAYGVAVYLENFSAHRSPRKIMSSQAVSITGLSVKGWNSISVKYA